jgi:hypothetical protein
MVGKPEVNRGAPALRVLVSLERVLLHALNMERILGKRSRLNGVGVCGYRQFQFYEFFVVASSESAEVLFASP